MYQQTYICQIITLKNLEEGFEAICSPQLVSYFIRNHTRRMAPLPKAPSYCYVEAWGRWYRVQKVDGQWIVRICSEMI